jgi:hypothetical protein
MEKILFPRTVVDGVSISRMIIGTNWIMGWSHTGAAADAAIRDRNCSKEVIADLLEVFLNNGVDAIMGGLSATPLILDSMKLAEDKTGKGLIRIDTPIINVDDNETARREADACIARCKAEGAIFCFPHHYSAEQLVDKNQRTIRRLPDYLKIIRDHGMIPGLSAHMPELIIYSDANEYDVQTYIQIYNCLGFMMQIEIESVINTIWNAKKPVMTIKPMAAGRCTPFVGLNFSWATLRPQDMVTVGCMTPYEAAEDIEISMAALERRAPVIKGRSSPKKSEIMR